MKTENQTSIDTPAQAYGYNAYTHANVAVSIAQTNAEQLKGNAANSEMIKTPQAREEGEERNVYVDTIPMGSPFSTLKETSKFNTISSGSINNLSSPEKTRV